MPSTVLGAEDTLGKTGDSDLTFEDDRFPWGRQIINKEANTCH